MEGELTVDQLIVILQGLSWTGKGKHRVVVYDRTGETTSIRKGDVITHFDSVVLVHPSGPAP